MKKRAPENSRTAPEKSRLRLGSPLALLLCAALSGVMAITVVRTALFVKQVELRKLREKMEKVTRAIDETQVRFAELLPLERLEREARAIGMIHPIAGQVVTLTDGSAETKTASMEKNR